jgi:hypothetical protein
MRIRHDQKAKGRISVRAGRLLVIDSAGRAATGKRLKAGWNFGVPR